MAVKCGNHNGEAVHHASVQMVRDCYAGQARGPVTTDSRRGNALTLDPSWDPWMAGKQGHAETEREAEEIRDAAKWAQPANRATRGPAIEQDGMYLMDDVIYKVQFNKGEGDGRRLYAKRLVVRTDAVRDGAGKVITPAVVVFTYAAGAVMKLRESDRMTIEQARAFGALYGTCVRCGRTLTREDSIERMMGSTCAAKMGAMV